MEKSKSKPEKCLYPIGAFSGITIDGKKIIAGTLRCNSWTCPACQPLLIKKLYKRILHGSIGTDATPRYGFKFLTLTFGGEEERLKIRNFIDDHNHEVNRKKEKDEYDPNVISPAKNLYYPEVVYDIMAKNFHKLIRALKKQYGNFHYFRVNELQKDGTPHFHVLLAGKAIIPKGILQAIEKKWAGLYGMGFVKINCVKFRDRKHAVRYMLKYITKDIKKPGKGKRIFTASRNALLKLHKAEWGYMAVHIGKVTDKGIHELELTPEHLTYIIKSMNSKTVSILSALKKAVDRQLQHVLICEKL